MIERILEDPENVSSDINDDNLLTKIWLNPTDTLKDILKTAQKGM